MWQSGDVLRPQRPGDGYSVWGRWTDGVLSEWCVDFRAPLVRTEHGFDTPDHEWDLIIPADGSPYRWKDVEHFEERCARAASTPKRRTPCARRPPPSWTSSSAARAVGAVA
ncbi:hypothetical protein ACE14D_06420 [Streptomyces sp. Act-28]